MTTSQVARRQEAPQAESLALITDAAEQLQRLADTRDWPCPPQAHGLLDDMLSAAASARAQISWQEERIRHLEALSNSDELTGLLNRRGFKREMARALARARRGGETGLLMLCDLDHFKAINDGHGHPAGDAVLQSVANLLARHTRPNDCVARWGGDEFAVLLAQTPIGHAEHMTDKLRRLIKGHPVSWRNGEILVSASLGLVPYDRRSEPESLLFRADRDLYLQKQHHLVHDRHR